MYRNAIFLSLMSSNIDSNRESENRLSTTQFTFTKKAQRYFKERNIKFQFINLDEKEMSKKEFESVLRQVRIDSMIDPKA